MADFQAMAQKYGTDNWNSLRGKNDPMFAGLDPNANWNSFRPTDTAAAPTASAAPTSGSVERPSGGQPQDYFPPGYQFPSPSDTRSPNVYGNDTAPSTGINRAGQTPPASGGSFSNPGGTDIDAIIRAGFGASSNRTPSDTDMQYWRSVWPSLVARGQQLGDPDYAWKRLIGMGAGPQDAAAKGPWAGGDPNAERMGGGGGAGAAVPGGGSGGSFSASTFARDPLSNPNAKALFDKLMGRADQSLNVNPEDPIIKNATNAYSAEQERGVRNELSAEAAAQGATGGDTTAAARSLREHAGQATSGFQAQQMTQELTARRQEIQDALHGAAGLLTAEQQMQLNQELHMLDNELQKYMFGAGLAQNESQFGRNLGQRAYEYDATRGDNLFG